MSMNINTSMNMSMNMNMGMSMNMSIYIRRPLGHEPFRVMKKVPSNPSPGEVSPLKNSPLGSQTHTRAPANITIHS